MRAVMRLVEIDAALARLGAEQDRIGDALIELDGHFGRKLLDGAALSGTTKDRWRAAREQITLLWTHFDAYRTVLDQARDERARWLPDPAKLTDLLTGPAVTLAGPPLPPEARRLTGPAHIERLVGLDELVAEMDTAFTCVVTVLAAADRVWSELGPRIEGCLRDLRAAEQLSREFQGVDVRLGGLANAARELSALRERMRADPLSLSDGAGITRLASEIAEVRAEVEALAALRDTASRRLAQVGALLREIAGVRAEMATACGVVLAKVADGQLPEPTVGPPLDQRWRAAGELRAQGRWGRLLAVLGELERAAPDELARARAELADLRRPLDERAELRGRLDAYRAKATRQGNGEARDLEQRYERARRLLWAAPCDLAEAATAVASYQRAVTDAGA